MRFGDHKFDWDAFYAEWVPKPNALLVKDFTVVYAAAVYDLFQRMKRMREDQVTLAARCRLENDALKARIETLETKLRITEER